jgi:hypothetical protein
MVSPADILEKAQPPCVPRYRVIFIAIVDREADGHPMHGRAACQTPRSGVECVYVFLSVSSAIDVPQTIFTPITAVFHTARMKRAFAARAQRITSPIETASSIFSFLVYERFVSRQCAGESSALRQQRHDTLHRRFAFRSQGCVVVVSDWVRYRRKRVAGQSVHLRNGTPRSCETDRS